MPRSSRPPRPAGRTKVMTRTLVCCFIAGALLLIPRVAAAQAKLTLVPSASVSSVYDDNLFAKSVGSADQMTLLTPGIETSYETPVTLLFGEYKFDMQRSLDHRALDNLMARQHAMLDTSFRLA